MTIFIDLIQICHRILGKVYYIGPMYCKKLSFPQALFTVPKHVQNNRNSYSAHDMYTIHHIISITIELMFSTITFITSIHNI